MDVEIVSLNHYRIVEASDSDVKGSAGSCRVRVRRQQNADAIANLDVPAKVRHVIR